MTKAFVLHRFPFKDADVIVKALSQEDGLISFIAKGAKRSKKGTGALLQPFLPVEIEYGGKSDLKKLKSIEMSGMSYALSGINLYSAFYANELLMYLCPVGVPLESVYELYDALLQDLTQGQTLEPTLRSFELQLLKALGFAPNLSQDRNSDPIDPNQVYVVQAECLPLLCAQNTPGSFSGETLKAIELHQWASLETLKAAKRLTRYWISHYANGKTFKSREMCIQLSKQG